ncbi:hypothetical protein [Algisphaera agarilytica]|uniref:DUF3352 domain-containing protein n=1 Tax=Algisphaera agarilytica TaxID=1385975 RepID=A0A7X0H5W8_9BACT|nr:hypothetical protein [Algisphaera agarilytica]MBB6429867.1 hypothetical protein [Algisphaera agarilytica]
MRCIRPLPRLARCAAPLLAAWWAAPALSQPLAEHVPADAIAYFGWAGTDSITDQYAQSALQDVVELIETDKLKAAWRSAMPTLRQAVDDPAFQDEFKHLTNLWGASARGAMAVYVTAPPAHAAAEAAPLIDDNPIDELLGDLPLDLPDNTPGIVLLWQPVTGDDRKDLLEGLKYYQSKSSRDSELVVDGPVVSLRINHAPAALDAEALIDPDALASLAEIPRFTQAMEQLEEPGPLVGYVDLPALFAEAQANLSNTSTVLEHDGSTTSVGSGHPAIALIEPLGLDTLGPAVITAGFDGRQWRTQMYLAAPSPRKGIASLLDAPALTADGFGWAPIDAPWITSMAFDTGLLMDLLRNTAAAMGPDAADSFEQGLVDASSLIGVDVENQLIRGLGPTWSLYLDGDAVGTSMLSLTLVNQLADPEGVERGLRSLQMFANLAMLQGMAGEDIKVQVHTQTYDGHDLHTLGTPLLSPTWAIVDGKLIAGLSPHTVLAAIDNIDQPNSLNQQDDFAALREAVGTRRLTSLTWVDLRRTAPGSYQTFIYIESLLTGSGSMLTGQPMPMVLPPLGRLKPLLEPAHAIGWVDDTGWHYESRMPFPGATLLAPQSSALGTSSGLLPLVGATFLGFQSDPQTAFEPVEPPQVD